MKPTGRQTGRRLHFYGNPIKACAICLLRVGFGCSTIERITKVNKSIIHRWAKKTGLSANLKAHNFRYADIPLPGIKIQRTNPLILVELKIKQECERAIISQYRKEQKAAAAPDRAWEIIWSRAEAVKYDREQRLTNPWFRAKFYARKRIRHAVKRYIAKRKDFFASKAMACSGKELAEHLERQFKPGMTWDNHGVAWHIDHLIPLSSAKTMRQMERLCHYSNLQPLWATDNIRKGDKIMAQQALPI